MDLSLVGALMLDTEQAAPSLSASSIFVAGLYFSQTQQPLATILGFLTHLTQQTQAGALTEVQRTLVELSLMDGDFKEATRRYELFKGSKFSEEVEVNGQRLMRNSFTGEIASIETAKAMEAADARLIEELRRNEEMQRIEAEEDRIRSEEYARKLQEEFETEDKQRLQAQNVQLDCQICYDTIGVGDYLPLDGCGHMFHPTCIVEHLENEINQRRFPLLCPFGNCKKEIRDMDLQDRLSPEMYAKYQEFCFNAELSCCPTPDCKYVFIWTQEDPHFQCPSCNKHYCLKCRCDWHKDLTCEENKKLTNPDELDKMFETMMKKTNFKQCPMCKFWVERETGCDFIKCRCGFAFCYKCGNGFKDCTCGYGYCAKCGHDQGHCVCAYQDRVAAQQERVAARQEAAQAKKNRGRGRRKK
jgi:hypothetical protein